MIAARLQLAPSILTADFARLGDEIASVQDHIDWVHLDVMDGHYVDNLTCGFSTVEAVRRSCALPLHVHLMITDPLRYGVRFVEAGATRVSLHPEVAADPGEVVAKVKETGAGVGFAVHPDVGLGYVEKYLAGLDVVLMMTVRPGFGGQEFMEEVLPKIESARRLINDSSSHADVEVDGGVKLSNVRRAVEAGGNILVAGSAIFDGIDAPAAAARLRTQLDALQERGA